MLGSGKSSGVVNEASNLKANQNLTSTIEQMATKDYVEKRDLNDVIPTHRRAARAEDARDFGGAAVYDPEAEKRQTCYERGGEAGMVEREENDDEDAELLELRRLRVHALRDRHTEEAMWRSKQHGQYREIGQDDFFNTVVREKGGSDRCCIHFYHKDFESCKVMDRRLSELAQTMLPVRFAKLDAERAPFLVERLRITTLPCCLLFKNDVCVSRILGFEGCVNEDGLLDPDMLKARVTHGLELAESE